MPAWLLPTVVGLVAASTAFWILGDLANALDIELSHNESYIDRYGEYQEGGLTRAGFFFVLLSTAFGGWAAGLVHTKRLDCGMPVREWQFIGAIFIALAIYVVVMHLLTVTFERQTRGIPNVLFNLLDLAILVGCGYAAFLLLRRARGSR